MQQGGVDKFDSMDIKTERRDCQNRLWERVQMSLLKLSWKCVWNLQWSHAAKPHLFQAIGEWDGELSPLGKAVWALREGRVSAQN